MARPHPIPFDTYRFVKRMTEAGMPASQAEALADEQVAVLNSQLATKQDLANLATKEDVAELAARLDVLAARQDGFATKESVAELVARQETLATKESVAELAARQETLATKAEVAKLRTEVAVLRTRLGLVLWLISSVGGGVAFLIVRTVWTG